MIGHIAVSLYFKFEPPPEEPWGPTQRTWLHGMDGTCCPGCGQAWAMLDLGNESPGHLKTCTQMHHVQ